MAVQNEQSPGEQFVYHQTLEIEHHGRMDLRDYFKKIRYLDQLALIATDEEVVEHCCAPGGRYISGGQVSVFGLAKPLDGEVMASGMGRKIDMCMSLEVLVHVARRHTKMLNERVPVFTYSAFMISLVDGKPRRMSVFGFRDAYYASVFTERNSRKPRMLAPKSDLLVFQRLPVPPAC